MEARRRAPIGSDSNGCGDIALKGLRQKVSWGVEVAVCVCERSALRPKRTTDQAHCWEQNSQYRRRETGHTAIGCLIPGRRVRITEDVIHKQFSVTNYGKRLFTLYKNVSG